MRPAEKYVAALIVAACILVAALIVLASCPRNGHGVELTRLEVGAAFAPPHNEPVVGDHVARYKIEGDGGIRVWKFDLDANAKLWFLNTWDPPDVVGHGFPEAWRNSRWGVEAVRLDWTVKAGIDLWQGWQFYGEHNRWGYLSETTSSQHVSEYYWLFGIRYKYK